MADDSVGMSGLCRPGLRRAGGNVRQVSESAAHPSDDVARICAFLEAVHPQNTSAAVGAAIGFSPDAFDKWKSGARKPSYAAFIRLVNVYGPELLAACWRNPPDWLCRASIELEQKQLRDEAIRIAARQADLARRLGG